MLIVKSKILLGNIIKRSVEDTRDRMKINTERDINLIKRLYNEKAKLELNQSKKPKFIKYENKHSRRSKQKKEFIIENEDIEDGFFESKVITNNHRFLKETSKGFETTELKVEATPGDESDNREKQFSFQNIEKIRPNLTFLKKNSHKIERLDDLLGCIGNDCPNN